MATNPIFDPPQTFAVAGQTRQLTSTDAPKPSSQRRVPATIQKLIAELGFRYRPASQADLEAHAGALAMLGHDLFDLPPRLLATAIDRWAVRSPYLPRAADLVALSREIDAERKARPATANDRDWTNAERIAAIAADRNASSDMARGLRWIADDGGSLSLEEIR